ncbi:c-type cytochrome [Curvivirga aplysinae]|uniref:c-type cytochrome n=1 Tax=Curvivirga aplysinae TaxID=2529852 RepID=UPI001C3F8A6F|nr:c-type cytochrome [Curvivirga aplysinae]
MIPQAYAVKTGDVLAEELGCNNCHGANGISEDPFVPNLAGQKYKYLKKQIDVFQSDHAYEFEEEKISERHHSMMHNLSESVTIYELNRVIRYYSKLACDVPPKRKITEIIPEVKRCEICHGGIRTNPFRDSPNLAGQKKVYMLRQLHNLIDGQAHAQDRAVRYHRLTELMVEGLNPEGIEKAVEYYSAMGCGPQTGR